jgi:hypothetical protein
LSTHIASDPYKAAQKILKKQQSHNDNKEELTAWKEKYRKAGPVVFAHEVLKIDPINGYELELSEDQQTFLMDLAGDEVKFFILIAGRGCGKTFSLAVYITWRLCTNDYWSMCAMGGSAEQSTMIHRYTTLWRENSEILQQVLIRDVNGREPEIRSIWKSSAFYLACSEKSTRGKHVKEFLIDEEVAGEKTKEGAEAIQAAFYQVSTSKNVKLIRSSTCQSVSGEFYKVWQDAEKLNYKRYNWSLAKHISGKKDQYLIYKDGNPEHWLPNVPWTSIDVIQQYRRQDSNEKFLVEVLGGISVGSGLVFKPEDISIALSYCDKCPIASDCKPYSEECKIIQNVLKLSGLPDEKIPKTTKECLTMINERIFGQDYGHGSGADGTVIIGRVRTYIFILFSDESTGKDDTVKLDDITRWYKEWKCECIRPDPAERAYNNSLNNKGLVVHDLDVTNDKLEFVHTSKKFMERHKIVIPVRNGDLIRGLRNISFNNGKIVKKDDHMCDAFWYAISRYGEIMDDEDNPFWSKISSANPYHNVPTPQNKNEVKEEKKPETSSYFTT